MTREERAARALVMDALIQDVAKHLDNVSGLLNPRCLALAKTKLQECRMWHDEALNIDRLKKLEKNHDSR